MTETGSTAGAAADAARHDETASSNATADTAAPQPGNGRHGATSTGAAGHPGRDTGDSGGLDSPSSAGVMHLRWWREVGYILLVYIAYSAVRNQFGSGDGGFLTAEPAYHHGEAIIQLQRNMGLYFEQRLQDWYLGLPGRGVIRFWNIYYGLGHFVVTATALVVMYRRHAHRYRLWRNTLAFTTLLALVGFASFALMPPRLMDDPGIYGGCQVYAQGESRVDVDAGEAPCDKWGFVDTVAEYGGWASFGSEEMSKVSNQFAAMPSMHIGWSTWCALVLVPIMRRRWAKVLVALYPVLTLFDIVVTGNHYWIDGVGGLLCLGVGYLIARLTTQWWEARFVQPGRDGPAPTPALP
jgi:PAP2 superfamily protein